MLNLEYPRKYFVDERYFLPFPAVEDLGKTCEEIDALTMFKTWKTECQELGKICNVAYQK